MTADLFRRWQPATRLARRVLRLWENFRLAHRVGREFAQSWIITREYQLLPTSQFDEPAIDVVNAADHTSRLYTIHRGSVTVLAAAAFDLIGGPGGAPLLKELALARPSGEPLNGALDPRAYTAATFLLELHDRAASSCRSTDIWLETCRGATAHDLRALGFHHLGADADTPMFQRLDTASADHALRRCWGVVNRLVRFSRSRR